MNPLAIIGLRGALGLIVGLALMGGWERLPWGLQGKLASATAAHQKAADAARKWEGHARGWQANFDRAEALRVKETTEARKAVVEADRSCDARVSAARRSASAIASIVRKEPTYDENRCPRRELADPQRVYDALAPRP